MKSGFQGHLMGKFFSPFASFTKKAFYILFCFQLFLFFTGFPLPLIAASKKKIAVIELFNSETPKQLGQIRRDVAKALAMTKRFRLASNQKVIEFLGQAQKRRDNLVEGDYLYGQAQSHFLRGEWEETQVVIDKAILQLGLIPGVSENLLKSLMLKAQTHLQLNQKTEANEAMAKASLLFPHVKSLSLVDFPPFLNRLYKKAHKLQVKKENLIPIQVRVRGDKKLPIFINGVQVGVGPALKVSLVEGQNYWLRAGENLSGSIVRVMPTRKRANKVYRLSGRQTKERKAESRVHLGFDTKTVREPVQNAIWMGLQLELDQVILLDIKETKKAHRLSVIAVDIKTKRATQPKYFDIVSLNQNSESAASLVANYTDSISRKDFFATRTDDLPILVGSKKKKSFTKSPAFWALIGVVAVGAGVGAAFGLGGGDSGNSDNLTAADVSGPAPSF